MEIAELALERFSSLSREEQDKLLASDFGKKMAKEVSKATENLKFIPNPGPQTQAYLSAADVLLYGGQAGGGKLQPLDSKVLTPFGWAEIGKLRVGSKICATDGTVTEVMGVFPQGEQDIYRVTFEDGGSTEAGLEHYWMAWKGASATKLNGAITSGETSAQKYTTAELIEYLKVETRGDGRRRSVMIPVMQPAAFNVAGQLAGPGNFISRPIDPYLLGLLIGDGCYTRQGSIGVTSMDQEIADFLIEVSSGEVREAIRPGNAAKSYHFRGAFRLQIAAALDALKITGQGSATKMIPRQYLFAPIAERWALLQGLMDTDGWVEPKRCCYYTTISAQLAKDVTHLARSLGAIVSSTEKIPNYTYKGEKKGGQKAYCLRIKMREPAKCFRLSRKKSIASEISHQGMGRVIESIKFTRRTEAVCIAVRHPNSLYITDDFIVTHNTLLELGLGINTFESGIIFRRGLNQTDGLEKEGKKIIGNDARFNGQDLEWTWPSGKTLKLAGMKDPDSWNDHAGRERDYMAFDEAGEFLEIQISSIVAWLRAGPGKRCRVVLGSNPPRSADGLWMVKWFAPWLDDRYPEPAMPGELRWAVQVSRQGEVEMIWVEGPGEYEVEGETYTSKSYTFIPASLEDNPERNTPEYRAQLQSLPEPLRSQLLYGKFTTSLQDLQNQCIPTEWVRMAQQRWTPKPPEDVPMCALGVDCTGGGDDQMVIAPRYDGWYAELAKTPGKDIPPEKAGAYAAGLVFAVRKDSALVIIDMGGGYGGPLYEHMRDNEIECVAYKGAESSTRRTVDGKLRFTNKRSAAYWAFREALDPGQPGGSPIQLPSDRRLFAGLTAPTFEVTPRGIQVEPKVKRNEKGKLTAGVAAKLGFSPDEADAVVMAWYEGARKTTHAMDWIDAAGKKLKPMRRGSVPNLQTTGRQPLSAKRRT